MEHYDVTVEYKLQDRSEVHILHLRGLSIDPAQADHSVVPQILDQARSRVFKKLGWMSEHLTALNIKWVKAGSVLRPEL